MNNEKEYLTIARAIPYDIWFENQEVIFESMCDEVMDHFLRQMGDGEVIISKPYLFSDPLDPENATLFHRNYKKVRVQMPVQKLVRCNECKHWTGKPFKEEFGVRRFGLCKFWDNDQYRIFDKNESCVLTYIGQKTEAHDFCSKGEKGD